MNFRQNAPRSLEPNYQASPRLLRIHAFLVVDENGEVLMDAQNQSRPPEGDPTQHAELLAASRAARIFPPARLAKTTLYTTAKHCCTCEGANEESPTLSLPCREVFARGQRQVEIIGLLLEDEAAKPQEGFWD